MNPSTPPLLVLDQSFPTNLVVRLPWPDVVLEALRDLHPDLIVNHDDWEVIRELKVRGGVDGFVTVDANMLSLEKEMCVLHQSKLSLIVCEDTKSDPFIATGLLMVHLPTIVRQLDPNNAQLWVLRRPPAKAPERPWGRIQQFAGARGIPAQHLFDANKLPLSTFK